jgi:hypothetical protein
MNSTLTINDLAASQDLDRKTMAAARGGIFVQDDDMTELMYELAREEGQNMMAYHISHMYGIK